MTIYNYKIKKTSLALSCASVLFLVFLIPGIQGFLINMEEARRGCSIVDIPRCIRIIRLFGVGGFVFSNLMAFSWSCFPALGNTPWLFSVTKARLQGFHKDKLCLMLALVFGLCVATRVYYIYQKVSLHVDEGLSVAICNRGEYGFWTDKDFPREVMTGKELKGLSFFDDSSIKDCLKDVAHLYVDVDDSPHTSSYYIPLRLWFIGQKVNDTTYLIRHGCLLNLVFFSVAFVFFCLMALTLSEDRVKVVLAAILAFMNPWSISNTVFLRPYEMQQASVIALSFLFVMILKALESGASLYSLKNFLTISLVLGFVLWVEYFNVILVGLLGLCLVVRFIRSKDWTAFSFFVFCAVTSVIVAKLLYLNWGHGLVTGRGTEAMSKMDGFVSNFLGIIKNFFLVMTKGHILLIASTVVFYISLIFALNKNKKNAILTCLLLVLLCSFMVYYLAPIRVQRYVVPMVPLLALVVFLESKWIIYPVALNAAILLISLLPCSFNRGLVEHLDDYKLKNHLIMNGEPKKISLVYETNWKEAFLLPHIGDEDEVTFIKYNPTHSDAGDAKAASFLQARDGVTKDGAFLQADGAAKDGAFLQARDGATDSLKFNVEVDPHVYLIVEDDLVDKVQTSKSLVDTISYDMENWSFYYIYK